MQHSKGLHTDGIVAVAFSDGNQLAFDSHARDNTAFTGDLEQVEAHKLGVHLCTCLALTIPITYEDMYNFEGTSNGRNGYSGGMQGCRVRYLAAPASPALLLFSFAHG